MHLPGRDDARFLGNTPSVVTGNEGEPNRKRSRFPIAEWPFYWKIAMGRETGRKRSKETKFDLWQT